MLHESSSESTNGISRSETPKASAYYDTCFRPGFHRLRSKPNEQDLDHIAKASEPVSIAKYSAADVSDSDNNGASDLDDEFCTEHEDLVFRNDLVWQNNTKTPYAAAQGNEIPQSHNTLHRISTDVDNRNIPSSFEEIFESVSKEVENELNAQFVKPIPIRSRMTDFRGESYEISKSCLDFDRYFPTMIPSFPESLISSEALDHILNELVTESHTETSGISMATNVVQEMSVSETSQDIVKKNNKKKKKKKKKKDDMNQELDPVQNESNMNSSSIVESTNEPVETPHSNQAFTGDSLYSNETANTRNSNEQMCFYELELCIVPMALPILASILSSEYDFNIKSYTLSTSSHHEATASSHFINLSITSLIPKSQHINITSSHTLIKVLEMRIREIDPQLQGQEERGKYIQQIQIKQLKDADNFQGNEVAHANKPTKSTIQTILSHTQLPEIGIVAFNLEHTTVQEAFMLNLDLSQISVLSCRIVSCFDRFTKSLFTPFSVGSQGWLEWDNYNAPGGWLIVAFSGYNCMTELQETYDLIAEERRESPLSVLIPQTPYNHASASLEFFSTHPLFTTLLKPPSIQRSIVLIHPKAISFLGDFISHAAEKHVLLTAARMVRISKEIYGTLILGKDAIKLQRFLKERVMALCVSSENLSQKLSQIIDQSCPNSLKDSVYISRPGSNKEVDLIFFNAKSPFSTQCLTLDDMRFISNQLCVSASRKISSITLKADEIDTASRRYDIQTNECDLLILQNGEMILPWLRSLGSLLSSLISYNSVNQSYSWTVQQAMIVVFSEDGIKALSEWDQAPISTQIQEQLMERPCFLIRLSGRGVAKHAQTVVKRMRREMDNTVIFTSMSDGPWIRALVNGTFGP